jgi:hypothetical protein
MNTQISAKKDGAILVVVMVVLVAFMLYVAAMLQLGAYSTRETEQRVREAQAFWLAEAGLQASRADIDDEGMGFLDTTDAPKFDKSMGRAGTYEIEPGAAGGYLSIGRVTVDGVTTERRVLYEVITTYDGYDNAVAAPKVTGSPWTLVLSGEGKPEESAGFPDIPGIGDTSIGGADEIYGNIVLGDGSLYMSGESQIKEAINNESGEFNGDVAVYDGDITLVDDANIAGDQLTSARLRSAPDLVGMDYPNIANYNLTEIFDAAGVTSGRLPVDHPLYNVVRRAGDDYYFEPTTGSGTCWDLLLGEEKIYYAEGNIWFDNGSVLQFDIDGTATIVASGNIHVGDGLRYESGDQGDDLVALVALGEYDEWGIIEENTGNVYFGDPRYGTVYEMDAFMFAANDFYYNLSQSYVGSSAVPGEPDTGLIIYGNIIALNQILIDRDWYTPGEGASARPAVYIPGTGWVDAIDYRLSGIETLLTDEQINGATATDDEGNETVLIDPMRHYQLIVKYDERIHNPETHPPGLPESSDGTGHPSSDVKLWQHADES